MRILLISSAFSGLTQRFFTELDDAGYIVSVELHHGDIPKLLEGVGLFEPDLIVCPFLTRKLPAEIYEQYKCLIVHPGIVGDRGPSSLDWAIQNGVSEWGVTLLGAQEEMDMGDIWASRTFPMRRATKSSLFNREVTQAAVECLWEVLTYFDAPDFKPSPLDYDNPQVTGRLQPHMKQADRAIDWKKHTTDEILRRIQAADGTPGVLDTICGQPVFLHNAHKEETLTGRAGEIIAIANHAICRATVDGALWIGHLKAAVAKGESAIKLPAAFLLNERLPRSNGSGSLLKRLFSRPFKHIDIDYTREGRQLPCQETWYELDGRVAYIHFAFHNGAMGTEQCRQLLSLYQHVTTLDVDVIVLMGGEDAWSNGIHLNHIEAADSPADESWRNINAIDNLVLQIINTLDKVTVSAIAGGAGAGGAMLALAADKVFARDGVVFNPHYKNMGQLYGSEYWTYLLPKRVGEAMAAALTEGRLPLSAKKAWRIGLVDMVLDKSHSIFCAQVKHLATADVSDKEVLRRTLDEKAGLRCSHEAEKPLAAYRRFELTEMHANFYGGDAYHAARKRFVYKMRCNETPDNIAVHRRGGDTAIEAGPGSMSHFLWKQQFEMEDALLDQQHQDFHAIAKQMSDSKTKEDMVDHLAHLRRHVAEHFDAEEEAMARAGYPRIEAHRKEHKIMSERLGEMDRAIHCDAWTRSDTGDFINRWEKHIVHSDMAFNRYAKAQRSVDHAQPDPAARAIGTLDASAYDVDEARHGHMRRTHPV